MRRVLLVAVSAALLLAPLAQAWTWPTDGAVLRGFSFDPNHPYTAGQYRGIDLAGTPGATVGAPAAGTVTFAGTVPSSGKSVTITTADGYAVTLTHLGAISVAKNAAVAEGAAIGTVAATGDADIAQPYVHLGVRLASDPNGYIDPLSFLPARVSAPPTLVPTDPAPAATPAADPVVADPVPVDPAPVDSVPAADPVPAPAPAPAPTVDAPPPVADAVPAALDPTPAPRVPVAEPFAVSPAKPVVVRAAKRLPSVASSASLARRTAVPPPMGATQPGPLASAPVPVRVHHEVVVSRIVHAPTPVRRPSSHPSRRTPARPHRARPAEHDLTLGARTLAAVRGHARHGGQWSWAWSVLAAFAALCTAGALARRARRRPVPTMDGHALLRHDPDLLRQRPPAHRSRLLDDRGRHPRAPSSPARRGDLLPHGRRRARDEGVACR
jgi:hypothetical protein